MPWACKINDKSIRLEDLDYGVVRDFAKAHNVEWVSVVFTPLQDLDTAKELIELCATELKVKPPKQWPLKTLIDAFELVDDDLPEALDEEGLPTKAEEGDPATAG